MNIVNMMSVCLAFQSVSSAGPCRAWWDYHGNGWTPGTTLPRAVRWLDG